MDANQAINQVTQDKKLEGRKSPGPRHQTTLSVLKKKKTLYTHIYIYMYIVFFSYVVLT